MTLFKQSKFIANFCMFWDCTLKRVNECRDSEMSNGPLSFFGKNTLVANKHTSSMPQNMDVR